MNYKKRHWFGICHVNKTWRSWVSNPSSVSLPLARPFSVSQSTSTQLDETSATSVHQKHTEESDETWVIGGAHWHQAETLKSAGLDSAAYSRSEWLRLSTLYTPRSTQEANCKLTANCNWGQMFAFWDQFRVLEFVSFAVALRQFPFFKKTKKKYNKKITKNKTNKKRKMDWNWLNKYIILLNIKEFLFWWNKFRRLLHNKDN